MAHKLTVHRGTSWTFRVEYLRDDVPESLVDATIRFTVKTVEFDDDDDDSTAIFQIDVTSHIDAAGGISQITLEPSDTDGLAPAEYWWDVKVEHDGGTPIYTLDTGRFVLEGSPTNRSAPAP